MKALFVDDSAMILRSIGRAFRNNPNVIFAECHNVEEVLSAVEKHHPDVLFLDHSLTEKGNEGFEVADRLTGSGVTIYSTSSNDDLASEYQKRGIEYLGKTNSERFQQIINV